MRPNSIDYAWFTLYRNGVFVNYGWSRKPWCDLYDTIKDDDIIEIEWRENDEWGGDYTTCENFKVTGNKLREDNENGRTVTKIFYLEEIS